MSLGSVTGRLLWSFCGVIFFFAFLCSLRFSVSVCIWSSSHFSSHYLLPLGEKYLLFALFEILRLSQTSYKYACCMLLVAEFLNVYALSILQTTSWVLNPLPPTFVFSRVVLHFSLAHRFRPAFYMHLLTISHSSFLQLLSRELIGSHPLDGGCVWVRHMEYWGYPWARHPP